MRLLRARSRFRLGAIGGHLAKCLGHRRLSRLTCHDASVDEMRYLEVVRRKTAKLFEAAARLGGVLGGVPPEVEQALAAYGMHLGTAFQLIDDVLDYSGDAATIGKSLGDDLAEGKPTLPLIRAMAHGTAEDSAIVRRAIVEGGRDHFARVLEAIRRSAALDYTRAAARSEAEAAQLALRPVAPSAARENLLELAAFSVTRTS